MDILMAVIVITVIGILASVLLVLAAKFLAVPVDERVEKVREVLPGANCGACGFAGCDDYAQAVCEGRAPANACIPGGAATAENIGAVLGVEVDAAPSNRAIVACTGYHAIAGLKHNYDGPKTCKAANMLYSGPRLCAYGCLGYGDCLSACNFGAICIVDGVAQIRRELCVGCGMCMKACPKGLISMIPTENSLFVTCSNRDKGALAMKVCQESCIACKRCEKACDSDAIHVINDVAVIDQDKCTRCGSCASVCPRNTISYISLHQQQFVDVPAPQAEEE